MKVSLIVVVATMVLAVTDAQFRLPNLFSGLRPLFGRPRRPQRPRPRPRPQTIFVSAGQFFQQNEQSNSIPQSSPASSFFATGQDVEFRPRPVPAPRPSPAPRPQPAPRPSQPAPRPAPRPTQQPPPPPPSSQSQVVIQRPQSVLRPLSNGGGEFGALKPSSILSTSLPFQSAPPPLQIFNDDNRIEDQSSQSSPRRPEQSIEFFEPSTIFKVTNEKPGIQGESFPNPLPLQNDNNIIGMLPPPLPISTTSTTTTTGTVIVTQAPLFSVTSAPAPLSTVSQLNTQQSSDSPRPDDIVATGPETNSIDSLILNPVPLVNAGILPLAGEISNDQQFFPPFNQISVATFNSEAREQRDLFPPFTTNQKDELFPPFNNNDS